jgi:hypothetical protein
LNLTSGPWTDEQPASTYGVTTHAADALERPHDRARAAFEQLGEQRAVELAGAEDAFGAHSSSSS